ncbi:MAG: hypothetical protein Q9176_000600 [Flavoplaca citrina]
MATSTHARVRHNLDELLSKWAREKAEGKNPVDKVEELLKGKVHPLLLMENHPAGEILVGGIMEKGSASEGENFLLIRMGKGEGKK